MDADRIFVTSSMQEAMFLLEHCTNLAIGNVSGSTLCLKKNRTNFETVYVKIIRIGFDETWLKCSKYSGVEFACFGFHVGLLFYQLFVFQTGHRK